VSLYRRLGGHEPLVAIVDDFSRRALADGTLAPSFAGVDPEAVRRRLLAFLAAALDGPSTDPRTPLDLTGLGLGLTGDGGRAVGDHLAAALDACGVPETLAADVLERVAALGERFGESERDPLDLSGDPGASQHGHPHHDRKG
jgi:hemoglobin